MSSPAPAQTTSLPPRAYIVSAPGVPRITSSPDVGDCPRLRSTSTGNPAHTAVDTGLFGTWLKNHVTASVSKKMLALVIATWLLPMNVPPIEQNAKPAVASKLTLMSHAGPEYVYKEEITNHKHKCVNYGKIKISVIDDHTLDWQWYYPNGKLGATTTLSKLLSKQDMQHAFSQKRTDRPTKHSLINQDLPKILERER